MMNLNGGYVMLDLNAKGLYAKAEALIGIDKPILLYPLNNDTPYYINKIAKVTEEGVTYINVNDEYKISSDGTITPIEPEPQTLPIATASVLGGVKIGANINVAEDGTISTHGEYTLPTATASVKGGVKIGANINVAEDGTISTHGEYTLPTATASVLGGVKIGSGINVAEDGTISVSGGSQHLYRHEITFDGNNTSGDNIVFKFSFLSANNVICNTKSLLLQNCPNGFYNGMVINDNPIIYSTRNEILLFIEVNNPDINVGLSNTGQYPDTVDAIETIFENQEYVIRDTIKQIL